MSVNPVSYPIVLRIVKGYVEASQPDLEIYRIRGKFSDIKTKEEIGAIVLDLYNEVLARIKTSSSTPTTPSTPPPSSPKGAIEPKFITPTRAARAMNVSITTVRRMCDSGKLDSFLTEGGHRRIKLSAANQKFLGCLKL